MAARSTVKVVMFSSNFVFLSIERFFQKRVEEHFGLEKIIGKEWPSEIRRCD